MDAGRQPIDRPTPALLINGVLAILRSQGFAWADIIAIEFAEQHLAPLVSTRLSVCGGLPLWAGADCDLV